ncbi:MAG: MFS transporter [Acidobacteria bacterium]|nr:MFS transporter [Acidobacteriota bacterium]
MSVGRREWKTLFAAQLGWMLDGMDVMLYAFALTTVQKEFGLSSAAAGSVASYALITSAVGGALAGYFADRYGRARVLVWSILTYSVFTGLTATAGSLWELALWRGLVGIGLGAEWSAGTVLVSETWPAKYRGRAIGFVQGGWAIGYSLAAALAAAILPHYGWRYLFAIGTLPALLAIWVQRHVEEPEVWRRSRETAPALGLGEALRTLVRPPLVRRVATVTTICSFVLFAYWGLFTWTPAYLASPVEKGGAGLGIVKSLGWVLAVQAGSFLGYMFCGWVSDRLGRRPAFMFFTLSAAALIPFYARPHADVRVLLVLGPLIGFFGHGYFSTFGSMLSELFPSAIRGTAQGLCYNFGRGVSALAPIVVGAVADQRGIGAGLVITGGFFAVGGLLVMLLPETKGGELA